jgi:hypothetical protein
LQTEGTNLHILHDGKDDNMFDDSASENHGNGSFEKDLELLQ